ncbi:hypothetical protein [Paenibacillus alkalitolerans]|uniref:hypothetical protein n=1 Tax=Paenibacillus alkalitolerans TaxID=2799335 RepID=UPI0018F38810|nr:hypothetical protein [Paenibacillus alkalitolerans]
MKLETLDQLGEAKRLSRRVKVYFREDGTLAADGVILSFDADTVSILDYSIGVVHFFREVVDVYDDASVQ